jgi:hypothetical protein
MARATVLSDARCRDFKPDQKRRYLKMDALCPGLCLRVYPSGKKTWALSAQFPGHDHVTRRYLGTFGQMMTDAAREKPGPGSPCSTRG